MSRAGRKRKNAPRTPTGQISRARAVIEREATSVVIEARMRLHGVSREVAKRPQIGTAVGRMYEAGMFGDPDDDTQGPRARSLVEAAERFARLHASLQAVLDTPGRVVEPRDGESRACPECGQTVRCDSCAADWADRVRWQWDALGKLLTAWEAALLRQVVIGDLDCAPLQVHAVVRALGIVGAYFEQQSRAA